MSARAADHPLRAAGFRGELTTAAPLAPLTTWKIGGPAELLAEPCDREDLVLAVEWARDAGVAWRVLGNGSNLLVRDAGVPGLVLRIRKRLDELEWAPPRVRAGAGVLLPALANRAAARGLAGLEFAAGIPGTLGGALVMNAGWHEFEIRHHVRSVDHLGADGRVSRLAAADCGFRYRGSRFRGGAGVVLGAELELAPGEPSRIRARIEHHAESRKKDQPTELPSCGSVFLKPPGDFAGRLIDEAGLKGLRVGAVEVSPKHANFFVNLGGGTAEQVLELVERVEQTVRERFGVELEREFELW
jgi:UDP-N-acetylmuramate dehydrogenase